MKKFALAAILAAILIGGLAAESDSPLTFYVTPGLYGVLGSSDALRGVAVGVDAKLDLFGFLTPGIQAMFEYDSYFSVANIPMMLQLGFGPNFWIGAGTTVSIGTPTLAGSSFTLGPFPNTYALGFGIPIIPLGDKNALKVGGQLSYTVTTPTDTNNGLFTGINMIAGFLASIRAYVGVQLELGF